MGGDRGVEVEEVRGRLKLAGLSDIKLSVNERTSSGMFQLSKSRGSSGSAFLEVVAVVR